MIGHTNAYLRLREQIEEMFDFTVTVCYAVPSLKEQIRVVRKGIATNLPKPDYFDNNVPLEAVQKRAENYKLKLARYLLLSSFSFFEAYVKDGILEMVEFHGGTDQFINTAERRALSSVDISDENIHELKRKLQEPEKPVKHLKYKKFSRQLANTDYKFPSELLASYGVRFLINKVNNLKSVDIPELLEHGLHLEIDAQRFHQIRDARNKIAHGKIKEISVSFQDAMEMNQDLRNFATKIDKHLIENFFIMEKYA